MDRAEQFRRDAARENRARVKTGWRYSPGLRALAVEHCRASRDEGRAWAEIASELGVSTLTLSRWIELASATRLRPVAIAEHEPPSPLQSASTLLSVITPGGLRIEGLGWPQILELVGLYR